MTTDQRERRQLKAYNAMSDKKKNFEKEYIKLTNRFERSMITHKLAMEYYGFRAFWFIFLPLTLISTAITMIGFLISGAHGDDGSSATTTQKVATVLITGESANHWSIVVGLLGAIATLLTTIGKHMAYQSHYDMHSSAANALEKICLSVRFELDWFQRTATVDFLKRAAQNRLESLQSGGQGGQQQQQEDDLDRLLQADLKSHQASFRAMQDSCIAPIPTRVTQAFILLEQIVGNGEGDNQDLIFHYHKLWKEFSGYPTWPLFEPNVNVMEKYREWTMEYENRHNYIIINEKKEEAPRIDDVAEIGNSVNDRKHSDGHDRSKDTSDDRKDSSPDDEETALLGDKTGGGSDSANQHPKDEEAEYYGAVDCTPT